ncbi:hypothetical protein EX30DRAFT_346722 [Ascodesmis nigricans]|uniref:DUF4604 domain-containing protein n=1 Tax=Ascodesmis nigricans TaxID=341454 RepID=A0A4V3SJH6_9PEZI|nr:hypothetical protein EX30DRAFT_346722 [Ascodesmis nigricans]
MSNAKKLQYDMEEPAFLQRMRAAAAGAGRQERYIAPRNRKTRVDDEEDEPQYVLEDGTQVTKAQLDAMEKGEDGDSANVKETGGDNGKEGTKETGNGAAAKDTSVVEAGVKKKRKAIKVVGGDAEEDEEKPALKKGKPESNDNEAGKKKKTTGKPKRKVKLSFDPEE